MAHGKQIRLFLADGDASGIRYAELVNWTGQAFSVPWVSRPRLKDWAEVHRPGVYVLLGLDAENRKTAYIGETENMFNRLSAHASSPPLEEITEVFFFTSKDQNLTKGHVTYLESLLVNRAKEAKRSSVTYGRMPSEKAISRPEAATMEEFLENIFLVSSALGYDIFEIPKSPPQFQQGQPDVATEFRAEFLGGVVATGYRSEDGFVVRAGSTARATETDTLGGVYVTLRSELKTKGVFAEQDDKLVFTQDYAFNSSSAAASVVSGSQRSGPQTWKRSTDGKLLKDVEAEEAAAEVALEAAAEAQTALAEE